MQEYWSTAWGLLWSIRICGTKCQAEAFENTLSSFVLERLIAMKPTRPEVIRGIPGFRALQLLRGGCLQRAIKQNYSLSQVTSELDEFWSHSWQTRTSLKYLCVLYLNNGLPAFCLGSFFALAAACFYTAGILPVWDINENFDCLWCTPAGVIGWLAGLLLWRRRKLIFLDVACIDQSNPVRKAEGLVCMGAFLRSSRRMLVLWDLSYTSRLWCVFELGAFLHSQKGKKADLVVCPVSVGSVLLVGQILMALFHLLLLFLPVPDLYSYGALLLAALCFPCFTILAYIVLAHCRSLDEIHHKVQNFLIEHSSSSCCDMQHIDRRTGERMQCDRAVISRCIVAWFGSLQSFEDDVRGRVREVLVHQLTYHTFTYWRMVQLTSPNLFLGLDLSAGHVVRHGTFPVEQVLIRVKDWLIFLPTLLLILLQLTYRLRRSCGTKLKQLLVSLLVVLVGVVIFASAVALEATLSFLIDDIVLQRLAMLAMHLIPALFLWCRIPRAEHTLA